MAANTTNKIPVPGENGRDVADPTSTNVIPVPGEGPRALPPAPAPSPPPPP
jgi:hypothetical protein